MTKITWRDVPMFWLDGSRPLTDAERVTALDEYRSTGGIAGIVLAEPNAEDPYDDSCCYAGPSVDEIDWAGFDALATEREREMVAARDAAAARHDERRHTSYHCSACGVAVQSEGLDVDEDMARAEHPHAVIDSVSIVGR